MITQTTAHLLWRRSKGGRKKVVCTNKRHYRAEFDVCLLCEQKLKSRRYLNWRKSLQLLAGNLYVTSRGKYCPKHPEITYLSAEAANLSLPRSSYGLDVYVRIGYLRDYYQMSFAKIKEALPTHIQVSERHLRNLYREYQTLLACADRLDVDKLKNAASKYGGLILSVDGLQPEGGQQGLWVAREVLTGTLLAAGWLPRDDETRLVEFLKPVRALDLPFLATVSDKQASLINALNAVWKNIPHQYCQAHYFSNASGLLYDADQHMKTQIRKDIRQVAGPTMREVLAQKKEKKNDDGIPALIVTGLVVQPPEGLHEVKAAAQASRDSRAPNQQSIVSHQSTSNQQADSTAPLAMSTYGTPIVPQASEPEGMSPIFPTAVGGTAMVQEQPVKEHDPSAIKPASIAQPPESQIVQPFSDKLAAKATACQIVCDSDAQDSQNHERVITEQVPNISSPPSQVVSEASPPSSAVCESYRDTHKPNVNVKPRQIMDDYRQIAKNQGVLIYQRIKKQVVSESVALASAPAPASRQELIDEIVCDYAARLSRILSRSGRKPFRLAGLRLYADLLALLASIEVSLTHLRDEPRLTCFADGIRDALKTYEDEYVFIAEGYSWLQD